MLTEFTAIDFETANKYPTSACQIGLVKVRDGKIVEEFSSLIKPYPFFFYRKFIEIHGITPEMVQDAYAFEDVWGKIAHFFETDGIVAHNAVFDMSVLRACLQYADIYCRMPEVYCTCRLSRRYLKQLPNHKLNTICEHFGIELNHHEALSDARGAAKILLNLLEGIY